MYSYRFAHGLDLPWLEQMAVRGAWESLSPDERRAADPAAVAQLTRQQVAHTLGGPGGTCILATAWNRPVGFVIAALGPDSSTDEMNGHLVSLWVEPSHRQRGIGRTLLTLAEELFRQGGIRKVKTVAGLHNQPAVRMAQRVGFKPEGLIGMKPL